MDEPSASCRPSHSTLGPYTGSRCPTTRDERSILWAFQARQPLRVVTTLPRDTDTDVPLNTGIEVTFDQDGVVDAAAHMTVEPETKGRFEQHGRVLAFVPDAPLKPATVYTVTVTGGVTVEGTGEVLESDVRFRFETTAPGGSATVPVRLQFSDDLFETTETARATLGIWAYLDWVDQEEEPKPPASAEVAVYRLADLPAAIDAFQEIRSAPRWTQRASVSLIPTDGLIKVLTVETPLHELEGALWFELPEVLPRGWYIVEAVTPSTPIQAMLQVTDIAGYLAVSDTKTLVWANDLATGEPVVGAVASMDATDLGRTDADGMLLADTPPGLVPNDEGCVERCAPVVVVRAGDRAAILPATGSRDPDGKGAGWDWFQHEGDHAFWRVFSTDRSLVRRNDTVEMWGVVRERDSGRVPDQVAMRMVAVDQDGAADGPPIGSIDAAPNEFGAFTGSLPIRDAPDGAYQLQLWTGTTLVASAELQVGEIHKPAYRLSVTTGRRVYVEGDFIRVTATATFYEGSPVPGLPLRLDGIVQRSLETDPAGTATMRTIAHVDRDEYDSYEGGPIHASISVTPAREEEAEIAGASREILIFPSAWTIAADAAISDGRVRVAGSLNTVDRDRLEREIDDGAEIWSLDPVGDPVAGKTVAVTFIESIPSRRQSGTRYDFVEKRAVPVYEYEFTEREAGTIRVRTDRTGQFVASVPADDEGHGYTVRVSATDPDDHKAKWQGSAYPPEGIEAERPVVTFRPTGGETDTETLYSIGDPIDLTMVDPAAASATDRFLFHVAQRGLRSATVQASPRYRGTFDSAAAPGTWITGVHFTGSGYTEGPGFHAQFRIADRAMRITLSTDAARYAPGDDVTVSVTTRDRSGDPVAATVILRAIDDKLFDLGAASALDPLDALYAGVEVGIRATYRTHRPPKGEFGGGDTGGGGTDRIDFKDSLLFRSVDTGTDGRAEVSFRASDDLTSWRVLAAGIGEGMRAGHASTLVPVGLPFFVDAAIAPVYLVSDRPAIGLAAFGTDLERDQPVTFDVRSETLGLLVEGVEARAFRRTSVPLPKLALGTHRITITARTGSGSGARRDRLTRTIDVVASRLERTRSTFRALESPTSLTGGPGRNEVIVADVSVARYLPLLHGLVDVGSARLERALAQVVATGLLAGRATAEGGASDIDFDGGPYQTPDGGLAVLPYSSSDLEASVLAALVAPEQFDIARMTAYFDSVITAGGETRERRNQALAGLAGLGAGVLPQIRAAVTEPELTTRERLILAIGAAALGDAATARTIETALIAEAGEADTDMARLRVGGSAADITQATALIALLAAMVDDPLAGDLWAYVEANPDEHATYALHAVGLVRAIQAHAPASVASFAYTIDGERHVVPLEPGATFRLALSQAQLDAMTIEPLTGDIGLTTSWREPTDVAAFERDPGLSIARTIEPAGVIDGDDLVRITLDVEVDALAPAGCHIVEDVAPSGLIPVGNLQGWVVMSEDEEPVTDQISSMPFDQTGQRVRFCYTEHPLSYVARVVTGGTYTWEPAIVRSRTGADRAAWTAPTTIEIR